MSLSFVTGAPKMPNFSLDWGSEVGGGGLVSARTTLSESE